MNRRKITEKVFSVGAVDWDRRLFDSLIPLPDGTSYNAYLIVGSQKTVLIDSVDPALKEVLFSKLEGVKQIDYIVCNHAEQDHSGSIPDVLGRFPLAKVVCSVKCKDLLTDHLGIAESNLMTVEDGTTLSLGDLTLKFIYTPWVHWPETMSTYLVEEKILFSCDFFGSHLATSDLFVSDEALVYESAKRYYAEIMMPFRSIVRKNLEKVASLQVGLIAPSHGPVYPTPSLIMDAYADWASDAPKNEVVIPYISMHGSTKMLVAHLVDALTREGVSVRQFDLSVTDLGKLAMALVDAATIVLGTPTVHVGPHPAVFYATHLANALRPKLKFASVIGSYGWATKAVEQLSALIPNLKVEVLPTVVCRGLPKDSELRQIEKLASIIKEKHIASGIA